MYSLTLKEQLIKRSWGQFINSTSDCDKVSDVKWCKEGKLYSGIYKVTIRHGYSVHTRRMEISNLFLCLISLSFNLSWWADSSWEQSEATGWTERGQNTAVAPSLKCQLQGSAHVPAFSKNGDFVIGGIFFLTWLKSDGEPQLHPHAGAIPLQKEVRRC